MKLSVAKRSVVVAGRKTSVSVEEPFWSALKEIAGGRKMLIGDLVTEISALGLSSNLSSSIRVWLLQHYRGQPVTISEAAE